MRSSVVCILETANLIQLSARIRITQFPRSLHHKSLAGIQGHIKSQLKHIKVDIYCSAELVEYGLQCLYTEIKLNLHSIVHTSFCLIGKKILNKIVYPVMSP